MSHDEQGWQAQYAAPSRGQQYRCIKCGRGGASGMDHKPLTYNCVDGVHGGCGGQATMWPTPQYQLYREQVLKAERFEKALKEIADCCNEPDTYATLILEGIL